MRSTRAWGVGTQTTSLPGWPECGRYSSVAGAEDRSCARTTPIVRAEMAQATANVRIYFIADLLVWRVRQRVPVVSDVAELALKRMYPCDETADRQSVGKGKSGSVRVDPGGG